MTPPVVPPPEPLARKVGRPSLCYTAEELAAIYNVSDKTVFRWADIGEIPCVRKGRTVRFPKALLNPILIREGILAP